MSEYPFVEVIKRQLEAQGKKLPWFLGEIDKSSRWFYGLKSIEELQLKTINAISKTLDFDLIEDLYKWQGKKLTSKGGLLEDPALNYKSEQEPTITVQINIKGTNKKFGSDFGKVLKAIQQEGEKIGFVIG
jgi:hypothetical protein